jgi:threonyl-tRNA synthetase
MPQITLPDGSIKSFDQPVSVQTVVASIGAGLAKAALAARVNAELVDLSCLIDQDVSLSVLTAKDEAGLEVMRHSCAHLMAQAVQRLFPGAQVTIGPVIEEGFYYDFSYKSRSFTPEDLNLIEAEMEKIVREDLPVSRSLVSRDAAIDFFTQKQEFYKVEIIKSIPADEVLSLYTQGEFTDLCRGPHVPSTAKIGAFKLMKLAGAYWRGDAKNEMLQRIYGTVWPDKKALAAYLERLEEAEKRDHRKISKVLDLYHIQEEAPGMVFWHPNGWTLYRTIEEYIRQRLAHEGYLEIKTPIILDKILWERSGHAANYSQHMFKTESENRDYYIKPMNCPCHVQVFNQGLKSYRDLPLRLAEFGCCHRNEFSGTLHGLMRVRGFTQDDAHIFCTDEQVQSESHRFIKLLQSVYRDFGFTEENLIVKLALRPEKRIGSDELWTKAEETLARAIEESGLEFVRLPNEGAFYGPKIEFHVKDCIGRSWQLGTLQLDYCLPDRLGAEYVSEEGHKKTPVMLHRAIIGTFERFMGILIEHHAGNFPLWLAPVQAVVMNITDKQAAYVEKVTTLLKNSGIKASSDLRNEKIGYKIREHTLGKVPYLLIAGDQEVEAKTLSVRLRDGTDLGSIKLEALIERLTSDIATYK